MGLEEVADCEWMVFLFIYIYIAALLFFACCGCWWAAAVAAYNVFGGLLHVFHGVDAVLLCLSFFFSPPSFICYENTLLTMSSLFFCLFSILLYSVLRQTRLNFYTHACIPAPRFHLLHIQSDIGLVNLGHAPPPLAPALLQQQQKKWTPPRSSDIGKTSYRDHFVLSAAVSAFHSACHVEPLFFHFGYPRSIPLLLGGVPHGCHLSSVNHYRSIKLQTCVFGIILLLASGDLDYWLGENPHEFHDWVRRGAIGVCDGLSYLLLHQLFNSCLLLGLFLAGMLYSPLRYLNTCPAPTHHRFAPPHLETNRKHARRCYLSPESYFPSPSPGKKIPVSVFAPERHRLMVSHVIGF